MFSSGQMASKVFFVPRREVAFSTTKFLGFFLGFFFIHILDNEKTPKLFVLLLFSAFFSAIFSPT